MKSLLKALTSKLKSNEYSPTHFCNVCRVACTFDENTPWPRDNLHCTTCGSNVRERAIYHVLTTVHPNYRVLDIHESSPETNRFFFALLSKNSKYSYSQFLPDVANGEFKGGVQSVDLENMPFPDNHFDILLSCDVLEHVFQPDKVFQEAYRTLKPGGSLIFTVPIDAGESSTENVAQIRKNGEVEILKTSVGKKKGYSTINPEYHGNPADPEGALLTFYWGYDIINYIKENSPFRNVNIFFKEGDLETFGIIGVMNEVIVCQKPSEIEKPLTLAKEKYYTDLLG